METILLAVLLAAYGLWIRHTANAFRTLSRQFLLTTAFATIFVVATPLILLQRGILPSTSENIIIAATAVLYFPFMVGRMFYKNDSRRVD